MEKVNQKIEDEPKLIDFKLENDWGKLSIKEDKSGAIVIEIFNKDGEKFILNSLLSDDWKIKSYNQTTKADVFSKEIEINGYEIKHYGWEYLLGLLHEIGHGVIFESTAQQRKLYDEFEDLRNRHIQLKTDPKIMRRLNRIHSKIERDAWAYAIRQLKKILKKLDIDITKIFNSNAQIQEYIFEELMSYKEWGRKDIRNMEISEDEKRELLEKINSLYVKEKNK